MESKLNDKALKDYAKAYSEKVLDSFYKGRDHANGSDILTLTKVKQVNLFIIYQLLRKWQSEVSQLESPYFDFRNKEVRKALKEFANVLSRHIVIGKEDIRPLIEHSVHDTLLLFLSPYDFYCSYISNWKDEKIKTRDLKTLSKYVKINHDLLTSFVSELEKENEKQILKEDALRILNEVFKNTDKIPEEIDPFVSTFSSVIPLEVSTIYGEEKETRNETILKSKVNKNEVDTPTLNDQLPSKEDQTLLADIQNKKRIESIKTHLTINQKFMFVNQLFDGNVDDFNQVVDFLDNCSHQAEAMDFINSNYLKKNNWNKDSTEVKEFIEVIARKYG